MKPIKIIAIIIFVLMFSLWLFAYSLSDAELIGSLFTTISIFAFFLAIPSFIMLFVKDPRNKEITIYLLSHFVVIILVLVGFYLYWLLFTPSYDLVDQAKTDLEIESCFKINSGISTLSKRSVTSGCITQVALETKNHELCYEITKKFSERFFEWQTSLCITRVATLTNNISLCLDQEVNDKDEQLCKSQIWDATKIKPWITQAINEGDVKKCYNVSQVKDFFHPHEENRIISTCLSRFAEEKQDPTICEEPGVLAKDSCLYVAEYKSKINKGSSTGVTTIQ